MPEIPRPPERTLLMLISGPAGSGKTTLCERLVEAYAPRLQRVVTATSRTPRAGEKDGVDYHFFNSSTFEAKIAAGEFFEYARVHGRHYGALKEEILGKLTRGIDLALNVDVQGARAYREAAEIDPALAGRLVTVFVQPPSFEELVSRLRGRGSDDQAEIARRIETAKQEITEWERFDYCFLSESRERDWARFEAIYLAEKVRLKKK